jgi:hypothetical protein
VPGAPIARPLVGIVMGGLSEHTSGKTAVMRSKWEPVKSTVARITIRPAPAASSHHADSRLKSGDGCA